MKAPLNLLEMNTLMDIAFLFQSVQDLKVMSQKFLQMLGTILPYEKAAIFLYQKEGRRFAPCAEIRCGSAMLQEYTETFSPLDYLGWQLFQQKAIVLRDSDQLGAQERVNTKFYQEYLCKYSMEYRMILCARAASGDLIGMAMLFRSGIFEDFSDKERDILAMLGNHFSAGVEASLQRQAAARRESLARKVYQAMPDVMLLLDENMNIVECNRAAEEYLAQLAEEPPRRQAFFQALRACCREMQENREQQESKPSELQQLILPEGTARIGMLPGPAAEGAQCDFVVVFSQEPRWRNAPIMSLEEQWKERFFDILRHQYSLTRREAHLIQLALNGMENQQIAQTLHISPFTVKSHFQNSYAKLGVKSRQELFFVYMKYLISAQFRQEFESQTRKDDYL